MGFHTTAIVQPSHLGWLCTCGEFWYQAQTADQAVRAAQEHNRIAHNQGG